MPTHYYNVRADMEKKPAPLLNPSTMLPMTASELEQVFCNELVAQELDDTTPYIPIPDEIRAFYKMYRPAPLVRAYELERKLNTPAHIYYKFEGKHFWQPQVQLRHCPSLLCQEARAARRNHRNGSRTMGNRAFYGLRLS